MAEYEIEPGVFYGRRDKDLLCDRYEYISYKRGNNELIVEFGEREVEYDTSSEYNTKLSIYTVKERNGVLNKLRKRLNKEPLKDKERIYPHDSDIFINRSVSSFLKLEDKSMKIKQENVRKLVEDASKLILEKGRPAHEEYERQQAEISAAAYRAREEAENKACEQQGLVAAKKINDFFNDGK